MSGFKSSSVVGDRRVGDIVILPQRKIPELAYLEDVQFSFLLSCLLLVLFCFFIGEDAKHFLF